MRRALRFFVLAAAAALVSMPTPARADSWVAPFGGVTFGSNADSSDSNKIAFGVDAGGLNQGVFGAEVDFGYLPSYFGSSSTLGTNYVMDLTGDLIIAVPTSATRGTAFRPFATVGLGLIRAKAEGSGGFTGAAENDAAFNVGGGAMAFFSNHVGLRGDVRYFRTVSHNSAFNPIDSSLGDFHFWRASASVVIR